MRPLNALLAFDMCRSRKIPWFFWNACQILQPMRYTQKNGAKENTVKEILEGIKHLKSQAKDLIVVTNEIFSDGICYDPETDRYQQYLGKINQEMTNMADGAVEVVYGIPVWLKGEQESL